MTIDSSIPPSSPEPAGPTPMPQAASCAPTKRAINSNELSAIAGDVLPAFAAALPDTPGYIFFTDFDGTITRQDSNDFLTDEYGFGRARRRQGNLAVLGGEMKFRDNFREMMESVSQEIGFSRCIEILLANIELDQGFRGFWDWCWSRGGGEGDSEFGPRKPVVPVVVLSGGMRPIILALLDKLLGLGEGGGERGVLEREGMLVSNDVGVKQGFRDVGEVGGWEITFHDDSEHGHDKSLELRKYSGLPERPIMFYAGDGVSDLSAARETDLLFAKEGCDLVAWCEKEGVPFRTFRDFRDIHATVKDIVYGRLSVKDAATGRQTWS